MDGPPRVDRPVDGYFRRGEFSRRMQPQPVTSGDGQRLVEAAYAFLAALGLRTPVLLDVSRTEHPFAVFETNPTVGLALVVPKQRIEQLPSRSRPRRNASGKTVRQKSDWYWSLGANEIVSQIVGSASAALERDHERVAALYCLSVAVGIARGCRGAAGAVTAGDQRGVYALLNRVDETWFPAVEALTYSGRLMTAGASAGSSSSRRDRLSAPRFGELVAAPLHERRPASNRTQGRNFACPIQACTKVFQNSRGGWDGHVGSLAKHPDWHAELTNASERRERFLVEFPGFFNDADDEGVA